MFTTDIKHITKHTGPAACPRCGGWTTFGGMSQHAECTSPAACDQRVADWNAMHDVRPGDFVRSFDFDGRDIEGDRACYVEGLVMRVLRRGEAFQFPRCGSLVEAQFHDCDRYVLRITRTVFAGKDVDSEAAYCFPPVNGTPTIAGSVRLGVVRMYHNG